MEASAHNQDHAVVWVYMRAIRGRQVFVFELAQITLPELGNLYRNHNPRTRTLMNLAKSPHASGPKVASVIC